MLAFKKPFAPNASPTDRPSRLSRARLDAILTLLADKESRLCDSPPNTPLIPLDVDPADADPLSGEEQGREGRSGKVVR